MHYQRQNHCQAHQSGSQLPETRTVRHSLLLNKVGLLRVHKKAPTASHPKQVFTAEISKTVRGLDFPDGYDKKKLAIKLLVSLKWI